MFSKEMAVLYVTWGLIGLLCGRQSLRLIRQDSERGKGWAWMVAAIVLVGQGILGVFLCLISRVGTHGL